MSRHEQQRHTNNEVVSELLRPSEGRPLSPEEIATIKQFYSGVGGLVAADWNGGQFFTPPVVTRFIVDLLGLTSGDILEPSCGGGAFLEPLPAACRVTAIDRNHTSARVCAIAYPEADVRCEDALTLVDQLRERFDYCIGNPPFVDVPKAHGYAGYTWAARQRDAVWFFIELGLTALRPGGWLAMIVPDGVLNSAKSSDSRTSVLTSYFVRAVISLPAETFAHASTHVKTSILVLQKPRVNEVIDKNYSIFMAIAREIGWDTRRKSTGKCDLPAILTEWRAFNAKVQVVSLRDVPRLLQEDMDEVPAPVEVSPASAPQSEVSARPGTGGPKARPTTRQLEMDFGIAS